MKPPDPLLSTAFSSLLARHLRLHRHLLALWRHTAALPQSLAPAEGQTGWEPWIRQRQRLLANLRACDGPRLTADTQALLHSPGDAPLCAALRALQQHELSLMQFLLSLERLLLRALNAQRAALARRLLSAHRAGAACSAYRRRANPPLTG
jgi:hypothetical protein